MIFTVEGKPQEIWAFVVGESDYLVSNQGSVKNAQNGHILRPYATGKGYLKNKGYMSIRIKGKMKKVHRLVAEAFLPNPERLPQVNHKDGNKFNNCVDNLEWCTAKDNVGHSVRVGLHVAGENMKNSKLTTEQVLKIRDLYKCGDNEYGAKPLARRYGVSPATIRNIVNYKKWRHVGL